MSIRARLLLGVILLGPPLVIPGAGCSGDDLPAAPPGPARETTVPDDATDYETEQGTSVQGTLRGGAWLTASFVVHAAERGGRAPVPATASADRGALEVAAEGRRLAGADLRGLVLHGTASFHAEGESGRAPARLRIEEALAHRNVFGRAAIGARACGAAEPDEGEYAVSISVDGAPFEPLCSGGHIYTSCPAGRELLSVAGHALAVSGDWDGGGYAPEEGRVTLTCLDGVSAKCRDWGFKPWRDPALHQLCTRLARADYAGQPRPRTLDGTPIQLFAGAGTAARVRPGYVFEAGWRLAAATEPAVLCLSKRRWSTMPLGSLREAGLADPREGDGQYCPEAPEPADLAEMRRRGAVLFTASPLIDIGLFSWRGPAGQTLTTTRYGLSRYDAARDQADSDPGDLTQLGYRPAWLGRPGDGGPARPAFEGTVFRHPVPAPWQLPADAVPLYSYTRTQRGGGEVVDHLTSTLPDLTAMSLPGPPRPLHEYVRAAEPDGYLFRPLPPGAPPPRFRGRPTVPLSTWYDPVGGHHLSTTDLDWSERSCQGTELCRPGDRHRSPNPDDHYVFIKVEGYLICMGCAP